MARLYAISKLPVLPSVHEPFGMPLLEALASGIPVVAYRSGGIPEVVNDGVDSFIVQPGDTEGFLEVVEALREDAEARLRMGLRGRERVKKSFGWEVVTRSYAKLYQDLQ